MELSRGKYTDRRNFLTVNSIPWAGMLPQLTSIVNLDVNHPVLCALSILILIRPFLYRAKYGCLIHPSCPNLLWATPTTSSSACSTPAQVRTCVLVHPVWPHLLLTTVSCFELPPGRGSCIFVQTCFPGGVLPTHACSPEGELQEPRGGIVCFVSGTRRRGNH